MNDRECLQQIKLLVDAQLAVPPTPPTPPPTPGGLRLLQWNSHHGAQGTDGQWYPDWFADIIAGANPDVVSLNEIETAQVANAFLTRIRQRLPGTWALGYDGRGNALYVRNQPGVAFSQLPLHSTVPCFLEYGATISRTFGSCHLDSRQDAAGKAVRLQETQAVAHSGVDLVLGDFNFPPSGPEYGVMDATYRDAWPGVGVGNGYTKGNRIDYVWVRGGAALTVLSAAVLEIQNSAGVAPSDHKPLLVVVA